MHQVFCGRTEGESGPRDLLADVVFISRIMLLLQPRANDYTLKKDQLELLQLLNEQCPDGPWDVLLLAGKVGPCI